MLIQFMFISGCETRSIVPVGVFLGLICLMIHTYKMDEKKERKASYPNLKSNKQMYMQPFIMCNDTTGKGFTVSIYIRETLRELASCFTKILIELLTTNVTREMAL